MEHDLARLVSRVHNGRIPPQITAALTPNALDNIGAAKTRTETTRPIMQARRPNSVSSPPHSIAPPAIAIPIKPIAYATGPVSDVAIAVIGRSHGNVPAAASFARTANAYARANNTAARDCRSRAATSFRVF